MASNIFKFSEVEAKSATPKTLRESIKMVLKHNDDACAQEILPFLTPPGQNGSREYDHCEAVLILLRHDAAYAVSETSEKKGPVAAAMDTNTMSKRMLWDEVVKVYRQVGFRFKSGRLVGLLEDRSKPNAEVENEENGDGIE